MAGGAGGFDDDDGGVISDINVTPLVDVMLVLLVVLMMTATAIVSQSIAMDLPSAATGEPTPQEPTTVTISIDGEMKLYLDRDEVTEDALRQALQALEPTTNEVRAVIAADGVVPHRNVVRIIDLLRQEDVTKFAINVRPGDLATGE